jgi:LacI family transcriptional regulator
MAADSPLRVALALDLTYYMKRHTDIFAGAVRYAAQLDDWMCVVDDFVEHTLTRPDLDRSPYDAIIGRATAKLAAAAKRWRLPLVNVWRSSPVEGLCGVYPDHARAGELAAEHLLSRGVRRLACVYRNNSFAEKLLATHFKAIADEAGCPCEMISVAIRFAHSAAAWDKTRNRIKGWLDHAVLPVGVFASLDILGRHIAQIAAENNQLVPRDVAIVSAHNEPTLCLCPEPTLTSIEYGFDHIGHEAARMMDGMLHGEMPDPPTVLVAPREIVRHSSDFVFIDDETVSAAMQFISLNSRKPITVDDVVHQVGVSRRTLEKKFAHHVGYSVAAEIRRVRIGHAKRLLASSKLTVAQISHMTGIGVAHQLARVFRREVGLSPLEYREQFIDRS